MLIILIYIYIYYQHIASLQQFLTTILHFNFRKKKKILSTLFKSKSPPIYCEISIIFVPMNKIKVPTIGVKGKVGQSYEEKEKILL